MCFEGEMSGVEEQYLRARIVPLEGFGPGREKERIGLAPGVPGSESAARGCSPKLRATYCARAISP